MKRLILILVLLSSISAWGTCGSGYSFHIAVKLIKASGSDQTNYPIRVSGRDYRLATVANGGQFQNVDVNSIGTSGPADLQFCPDLTTTGTPLKYESVYYDATLGDYEFYVQQPTLHTASNDTIYLYANNAAVTTSQQDLSLWADINYVAVFHYYSVGTIGLLNSVTGSAATNVNTATANLGSTFGAGAFNGTNQYLRITTTAALEPASAITLESYGWPTATTGNEMISKPYRTSGWLAPFLSYRLLAGTSGGGPGRPCTSITTSATRTESCAVGELFGLRSWSGAAGTYDGANIITYFNGASVATTAKTGTIDYNAGSGGDLVLGTATPYTAVTYWGGRLDEQRIASDAKSPDYLATQARNLSPFTSSAQFTELSYAKPTILQYVGCSSTGANASCVFPFDITNGGVITLIVTQSAPGGVYCPSISDTLTLTYTGVPSAVSNRTTGVGYSTCILTAPITTSGANTVTIPASGTTAVSAIAIETKGTTTTGVIGTAVGDVDQPQTLTATSPGADSLQICSTVSSTTGTWITTSTTPSGLWMMQGPSVILSGKAVGYAAYGIVGTGSQSCSFNAGASGSMIMLASAPSSTGSIRHRVIRH